MSFNVKTEIHKAIAETGDQNLRTILMLLLGVLEELGGKIDAMAADEKGLREAVLNGHTETHDRDHEWAAIQIDRAKEIEAIRAWALRRMASTCESGCEWAEGKRLEEIASRKTAAEDAKADKRAARDAIIRLVLSAIVGAAASGTAIVAWLGK